MWYSRPLNKYSSHDPIPLQVISSNHTRATYLQLVWRHQRPPHMPGTEAGQNRTIRLFEQSRYCPDTVKNWYCYILFCYIRDIYIFTIFVYITRKLFFFFQFTDEDILCWLELTNILHYKLWRIYCKMYIYVQIRVFTVKFCFLIWHITSLKRNKRTAFYYIFVALHTYCVI